MISGDDESDSSDDEGGGGSLSELSEDEADALPVYLWKPKTTDALGEWEKHTKVCLL